jgi:hypothetical protein
MDQRYQAISIFFFAWISDKYRRRALFIAFQTLITLVGLCLTGFGPAAGWRYAGEEGGFSPETKFSAN